MSDQLRNTIAYLTEAQTHGLHSYTKDMDGPEALAAFTNATETGILLGIPVKEMVFYPGGIRRGNGKTDNAVAIATWRKKDGVTANPGWTQRIIGMPRPTIARAATADPLADPFTDEGDEAPEPVKAPKQKRPPKPAAKPIAKNSPKASPKGASKIASKIASKKRK